MHSRISITLFIYILGLAPCYAVEYVLENTTTRLVIENSCLKSLFDKVRSIEHISPKENSTVGIFYVELIQGIQSHETIDATKMDVREISIQSDALELEFAHASANVRMQLHLSKKPGEVVGSLTATPSDNKLAIGSVAFPVFETPVVSDGLVKNCLLPMYEGKLHPLNVKMIEHKPKVYPSTLFAQMVACLGPKGGLVLWCDDTAGHVKEFKYKAADKDTKFSIIHRMPYQPGEWKQTYNARISFSDPSWYDAAEIYRKWAAAQPWSAVKFKDRTDVPSILHQPPFHASVQLSKERDLDNIPDRLTEFSKSLDVPILVRGTYWEKHGGWIGIDYFPPSIGEAGLRTFSEKLKARDIKLDCEITGYHWQSGASTNLILEKSNLTKEHRSELGHYFIEHNGPEICEMERDGKLPSSATVCRGCSFGKNFLQDMASELFDRGLTAFHDDSDAGPTPDGVSGCFNKKHGHPIPCGPWSSENTLNAFHEIRAEAARRGISDLLLTKEYCTERFNMDVHAYLARMSWSYTQPYVVPLTQFLYHEYLPVLLYNTPTDELADVIIFGQIPGGSISLRDSDALRDYYASMKGHAKPFLLYGRMLAPLVEGVPMSLRNIKDDKNGGEIELAIPHVRHSVWADGSGNVGVFAINTQEREITVHVPVPTGGPCQAAFYLGATLQQRRPAQAGETLLWQLPVGRLASIVLETGKGQ